MTYDRRQTRKLDRVRKSREAMEAKSKPGAARKGKSPAPLPRRAPKTSGQAALRQKARTPRMKAIQAHVSSRGRRAQARRDSR